MDLNTFILSIFKRETNLKETDLEAEVKTETIYSDLDHLAGTWSEDEAADFLKATTDFNTIDNELWQ